MINIIDILLMTSSIALLIGFGYVAGREKGKNEFQNEAVEMGKAQYNQQTQDFEWL